MGIITVILIIFGIVYSIWLFFFPLMVVKRLDKLIKILEKNEKLSTGMERAIGIFSPVAEAKRKYYRHNK